MNSNSKYIRGEKKMLIEFELIETHQQRWCRPVLKKKNLSKIIVLMEPCDTV